DYGNMPALTVNGGATSDAFEVLNPNSSDAPGASLPVILTVNGGTRGLSAADPNTLTLFGASGEINTFTNTPGANPTTGSVTLNEDFIGPLAIPTGSGTATVVYTGLQDPSFVGGGGTGEDILNLTGAGNLSVTGTSAGAGTVHITGQSAITFS